MRSTSALMSALMWNLHRRQKNSTRPLTGQLYDAPILTYLARLVLEHHGHALLDLACTDRLRFRGAGTTTRELFSARHVDVWSMYGLH